MKKQIERIYYILLIFALNAGYVFTAILAFFPFLIPKSGKKKDVLLFPYYPKNNPGAIIRFQNYLKFFQEENISYKIHYVKWEKEILDSITGWLTEGIYDKKTRPSQYLFYIKIFWKRIFQVLTASNYKAVFIHRGLFPYYPDQKFPYLERLLRTLNNNITIDFYDANYAGNKELVEKSVKYCDKITVVNPHLYNYFSKLHPRVFKLPLALDPANYLIKKDYCINNPIRLFWSGSMGSIKNLQKIIPALKEVSISYNIELIVTCPKKPKLGDLKIKHYKWDENTFFKLMQSADIAIYPSTGESETEKGKMALKVLEYMASALPIVASSSGISPFLKDKVDVLCTDNITDWKTNLIELFNDQELRKKIGQNAHLVFKKHHLVENSYHQLKNIIFKTP